MSIRVVIVGGGQAAVSVATRLRKNDYSGDVLIYGEEPALPYQRPPLSKAYLKGELALDRLFIRPQEVFDELNIELHTGVEVLGVDVAKKRLELEGLEGVPFDKLVLTTGSSPRTLPSKIGGDLSNVYTFRTLEDADRLSSCLKENARMLIVGGGYIGLEMAAVATQRGMHVTVVEMQDRILKRVAAPQTSDFFRRLHTERGVQIAEDVYLEQLESHDGTANAARLSNGRTLEVDIVIVGIGVDPNDTLAERAGIKVENGIYLNENCQTSEPDVYAAGDCANFPYRGERTRLESVQNACDQGEYVADHICGIAEGGYEPQPWFWSDQYDVSMKIAGLNRGYDLVVERAGSKPNSASVWYFAGERFLAVDAMNDPKAYMTGKRWLAQNLNPDISGLSDPTFELARIPTNPGK